MAFERLPHRNRRKELRICAVARCARKAGVARIIPLWSLSVPALGKTALAEYRKPHKRLVSRRNEENVNRRGHHHAAHPVFHPVSMRDLSTLPATSNESLYDGDTSTGKFDLSEVGLKFTSNRNPPNTITTIGTTNRESANRFRPVP